MKHRWTSLSAVLIVLTGWMGAGVGFGQTNATVSGAGTNGLSAGAGNHKAYVLGTNGTLLLTLPSGWKDQSLRVPEGGAIFNRIVITPNDTNEFNLALDVVGMATAPDMQKQMTDWLVQNAQRELSNCVETTLRVEDFKGEDTKGDYVKVTDRQLAAVKPKPGEYKYMVRGFLMTGPLVATFDLVSNDADKDVPAVIGMLKQAGYVRY